MSAWNCCDSVQRRICIDKISGSTFVCRSNFAVRLFSNKAPSLLGDLVIASPEELNEAESVAERIGHQSELAPLVRRDGLL